SRRSGCFFHGPRRERCERLECESAPIQSHTPFWHLSARKDSGGKSGSHGRFWRRNWAPGLTSLRILLGALKSSQALLRTCCGPADPELLFRITADLTAPPARVRSTSKGLVSTGAPRPSGFLRTDLF